MSRSATKRTLTAIVVADVVGYSRLMGDDEAGTLRRFTEYRTEILDPTVARHRGRIVNSVGDSLLMEFGSVVEATLCAIALQRALAERNRSLEEHKRLMLRMGVNIGDVIVKDRTLFGDGVNVAARLQTLSEPGGICLSSGAHEQIAGKIDAPFTDMGRHRVKNIAREIHGFGLSADAIGKLPPPAAPAPPASRRAIAIGGGILAALLSGVGVVFYWTRPPELDFAARMSPILATTQAKSSERARDKTIADYLANGGHKAFVIAPKAQSHWWTGDWPSAEIAVQKALERCQLAFAEPCQLIAADAEIKPPSEASPPRDMSKLAYDGDFDVAQIPGIRQITAERADVVGYARAPEPKAAAIHPRGLVSIVTGASSQHRAEVLALKTCNNDDAVRDADGPCFLYAQGNKVVLPRRRTTAITPP